MAQSAMEAPKVELTQREKLLDEEIQLAIDALAIVLPEWHISHYRTDRGTVRIIIDTPDGARKVVPANP